MTEGRPIKAESDVAVDSLDGVESERGRDSDDLRAIVKRRVRMPFVRWPFISFSISMGCQKEGGAEGVTAYLE